MSVAVISVANIQFCNSGCQGFEVNKRYDVIGMVQFTFIFRFIFINCNRTITNNLNSTIMKTRNKLETDPNSIVPIVYGCYFQQWFARFMLVVKVKKKLILKE